MSTGALLVMICVAGETARELCFKRTAIVARESVLSIARSPFLWAGLAFWAAEALLWIVTLRHVSLAFAVPLMALSFATVPLAAQVALRERLRGRQILGIALIGLGALCVDLSGSLS